MIGIAEQCGHEERRRRRLASLVLLCAVYSAQAQEASARVTVTMDGGRVMVEAENARVEDVAAAIAAQAGIVLRSGKALEGVITRRFTADSVESAMRRVLDSASVVMVYAPGTPAVLEQVWIYGPRGEAPVIGRSPLAHSQPSDSAEPESAVEELLERLQDEPDVEARRLALQRLARMRGEAATEALLEALADEQPQVREEAVRALATRPEESALLGLGQAAFGDEDPKVRLAAVRALEGRGGTRARAFLEAALEDPDPEVRSSVAGALQRMR